MEEEVDEMEVMYCDNIRQAIKEGLIYENQTYKDFIKVMDYPHSTYLSGNIAHLYYKDGYVVIHFIGKYLGISSETLIKSIIVFDE